MFRHVVRDLAREAASSTLEAAQATHTYFRRQRRRLLVSTLGTVSAIELVGNAVLDGYTLVSTGSVPSHETLATNALIVTLVAVAIEHLVAFEVLRLALYRAPWRILGQPAQYAQSRHILTPERYRYLPPASLVDCREPVSECWESRKGRTCAKEAPRQV